MQIEPALHERFVRDFGLNMLNTLTLRENRLIAHRRRIFVFDERGGMFGGQDGTLADYQNLTTGVFHSRTRKVVGVRYRCRPNTLEVPELGAFHTHPAAYSPQLRLVRQRIERLLWLSDMDVKAFLKQHELYGYTWHFIGTIDVGCFHIDDVRQDIRAPREVIRYPRLEEAVATLEPQIRFYDDVLQQGVSRGGPSKELLEHVLTHLTARQGEPGRILAEHDPGQLPQLAGDVASQFQLLGYSSRQVTTLIQRTLPGPAPELTRDFTTHVQGAYARLSVLSS